MPTKWNELETWDATQEEFAAMPSKHTGKGIDPQLVAILDAVEAGGIKGLRLPDASRLRGLRVALGRGATQRGFKLDYRTDGERLYVSRSNEPLKPKPSQAPGTERGRGRPRKQEGVMLT